ncbi:hypothetical protein BGZ60DRAFT_532161 [Tricladium varicosporioides]|nr:hypothetical protein BGZ60DRAFT_532161 [Hymenoscyphus varicosporioides]
MALAINQDNWRWCKKCSGLTYLYVLSPKYLATLRELAAVFKAQTYTSHISVAQLVAQPADPEPSLRCGFAVCPSGGVHDHSQSGDYSLRWDSSPGQNQWKWCKKCMALSWTGNGEGPCPAGNTHDTSGSANYVVTLGDDTQAGQHDWRWCSKCQGMHYIKNGEGKCIAGGNHDHSGSGNYTLSVDGIGVTGQQDKWRWCNKCQQLAYDGFSSCAGGGAHVNVGSGSYNITYNNPNAKGQDNWKWCTKCYTLSFDGSASKGSCPNGGVHDHGGSGNYVLAQSHFAESQDGWGWCSKCQMLWYTLNGPARCPHGTNEFHDSIGSGNYSISNTGLVLPILNASITATSPSTGAQTNVAGSPSSNTGNSGLITGAKVGIAVAAVLVGAIVIGAALLFRSRRRARSEKTPVRTQSEMAGPNQDGSVKKQPQNGFYGPKNPPIEMGTPSPLPVELEGSRTQHEM